MTSRMRSGTSQLYAALAAMLCMGMATGAGAAIEPSATATGAAPTAQQPVEELEVLDEIRVRGKSLARDISDAEDDFFKLYNKLNRNAEYDISCGQMSVNGSLIRTRFCVPGFLTAFASAPAYFGPSYVCNSSSAFRSGFDLNSSEPYYQGGGCFHAPMVTTPTAAALVMHKGEAYVDHVIDVINSDPRLKAKVRNLDALYAELQRTQGRYVQVHGIGPARAMKVPYVAPPRTQPTQRPR